MYGPDGRYGCYISSCVGAATNLEISTYASVGFFNSYDEFGGESITIVESAGEGISFVTAQVLNLDGDLVGTADCLSLGVSLLPISIGIYDCVTIVDTVGQRRASDGALIPVANSPPLARCKDVVACAAPDRCAAVVDIDNGSVDPDGDSLIRTQIPPGPYGLGSHAITLMAVDSDGAFDICTGQVTIDDCQPAQADFNADGAVDLRDAAALFNCHRGPGTAPLVKCDTIRVDCDADIDGDDLRHFVPQMTGP